MRKYDVVPWMLSIFVPVGFAWIAGFAISQARNSDPLTVRTTKSRRAVSKPQIAAPMLLPPALEAATEAAEIDADSSLNPKTLDVGSVPIIRDSAAERMDEPLSVTQVQTEEGVSRSVKVYELPLDDGSAAQ